jgi:hypothetical protein
MHCAGAALIHLRPSDFDAAEWTKDHRARQVSPFPRVLCRTDRSRNQAYLSTLRQEPEFADRGAGDIVSRLGIDTGIVGDSVTSNLSDGLRCVLLLLDLDQY